MQVYIKECDINVCESELRKNGFCNINFCGFAFLSEWVFFFIFSFSSFTREKNKKTFPSLEYMALVDN